VPCVTQVTCVHRSQNKVVGNGVFATFLFETALHIPHGMVCFNDLMTPTLFTRAVVIK